LQNHIILNSKSKDSVSKNSKIGEINGFF